MQKIKTSQKITCFMVLKYNEDTCKSTYFGGFYNEAECPGTDEELQFWECEDWFNTAEEALKFKTYQEAHEYCQHLDKLGKDESYRIILHGWNDVKNADGNNWYPLKEF